VEIEEKANKLRKALGQVLRNVRKSPSSVHNSSPEKWAADALGVGISYMRKLEAGSYVIPISMAVALNKIAPEKIKWKPIIDLTAYLNLLNDKKASSLIESFELSLDSKNKSLKDLISVIEMYSVNSNDSKIIDMQLTQEVERYLLGINDGIIRDKTIEIDIGELNPIYYDMIEKRVSNIESDINLFSEFPPTVDFNAYKKYILRKSKDINTLVTITTEPSLIYDSDIEMDLAFLATGKNKTINIYYLESKKINISEYNKHSKNFLIKVKEKLSREISIENQNYIDLDSQVKQYLLTNNELSNRIRSMVLRDKIFLDSPGTNINMFDFQSKLSRPGVFDLALVDNVSTSSDIKKTVALPCTKNQISLICKELDRMHNSTFLKQL